MTVGTGDRLLAASPVPEGNDGDDDKESDDDAERSEHPGHGSLSHASGSPSRGEGIAQSRVRIQPGKGLGHGRTAIWLKKETMNRARKSGVKLHGKEKNSRRCFCPPWRRPSSLGGTCCSALEDSLRSHYSSEIEEDD